MGAQGTQRPNTAVVRRGQKDEKHKAFDIVCGGKPELPRADFLDFMHAHMAPMSVDEEVRRRSSCARDGGGPCSKFFDAICPFSIHV